MSELKPLYTKANPFLAKISERYSLCKPGSQKSTFHVSLNIKGSGMTYQVGDSISVQPSNDPHLVKQTLDALNATGEETIIDKHTQEAISLKKFLTKKANLSDVPRKLIAAFGDSSANSQKKERLQLMLSDGQKELLKEYQGSREVWDFLAENEEAALPLQDLCNMLQPLLPRFYSVASSMTDVGEEVHLTVADFTYETNGHLRKGVCTNFLCNTAPLNASVIPIYVQPSHGFTLPEANDAPIIMVGPGTGVAPYRGFMQERIAKDAAGLNWLFFGEWHRAYEFFYEDFWQQLVSRGILRLDTAFSRDQEHKVYVQHRMMEHGSEIFDWLSRGAYLYVCGDAKRMAKDVDLALHHIIQLHGGFDEQGTKEFVKKMKAEKRYLRDVY